MELSFLCEVSEDISWNGRHSAALCHRECLHIEITCAVLNSQKTKLIYLRYKYSVLTSQKASYASQGNRLPPRSSWELRSYWLLTKCVVVISYRRFGRKSWPLKMGPIGFTETSVRNYHYTLRSNTEQHSSQRMLPLETSTGECCVGKFYCSF